MRGRGACVAGGMYGGGSVWQGGMCGVGGCAWWGRGHVWLGGMHGGGVCGRGHVWCWGVCMVGGMHGGEACMEGEGQACMVGVCMAGGMHGGVGGMCGMHAPQQILRDTVMWSMRGWYASYWNAFLLSYVFIVFSLFCITFLCTAFKSFRCIVTGPPGSLLFNVKPEITLK